MARDRGPVRGQPVPAQATAPSADRGSLAPDLQAAALTAAIASLTQHISAQSGAISANTAALVNATRQGKGGRGGPDSAPPRPTVGKGADPLGGIAGALAGGLTSIATQLIAPLAPLAVLAQTLSTTTSGFGPFLKMTGLITTALAGLFLPAMLVAGGATFAVAMMLKGPMLDAMTGMLPSMEAAIQLFGGLADGIDLTRTMFDELGISLDMTKGTLGQVNEVLKEFGVSLRDVVAFLAASPLGLVAKGLGGKKENKVPEWDAWREGVDPNAPGVMKDGKYVPPSERGGRRGRGRMEADRPGAGGKAGDEFMRNMFKGMDLMMKSMRQDLGPPATFGTEMASIWKDATLAGLNQDPIAAEQLKLMHEQLDTMQKMLDELKDRGAQYN